LPYPSPPRRTPFNIFRWSKRKSMPFRQQRALQSCRPIASGEPRPADAFLAFSFFDRVIGKHLYIDYSIALDPAGRIRQVDILAYRESYGGEIRSPNWLSQFIGKSSASPLQVGNDIRNISGATLSSHHVTEGVKRIMTIANRLK
jgi:hypothetical protein